jgi:hypothetical protein
LGIICGMQVAVRRTCDRIPETPLWRSVPESPW